MIPIELVAVLHHACSLTFTQRPDYDYIHNLLSVATIVNNAQQTTSTSDDPVEPILNPPGLISMPAADIAHSIAGTIDICKPSPAHRTRGRVKRDRTP